MFDCFERCSQWHQLQEIVLIIMETKFIGVFWCLGGVDRILSMLRVAFSVANQKNLVWANYW